MAMLCCDHPDVVPNGYEKTVSVFSSEHTIGWCRTPWISLAFVSDCISMA